MDDLIRSFIAVELPGRLVEQLKEFQSGLKAAGAGSVKWVDPASIHLTLKFLGNVALKDMVAVKERTSRAVNSSRRFNLTTGQTGFFPDERRPRVFWLGLEGDTPALTALQRAVDEEMSKLGHARENRPFTGHLTLARLREESSTMDRMEFARAAKAKVFQPAVSIGVTSVSLMRSQLTPRGAVYTKLAEFGLPAGETLTGR